MTKVLTVGVLALQGAFREHIELLRQAATALQPSDRSRWKFMEVRKADELSQCDALIIPGGESTTMALIAARSNLLEPLREFVKIYRKPTWGTCAGLILLAESANRTKKGGQDLIGGLDIRVNRNYFGRQAESFEASLDLPFLACSGCEENNIGKAPFKAVFIRAPVVERILTPIRGEQLDEGSPDDTVIAPSHVSADESIRQSIRHPIEIMARISGRGQGELNGLVSTSAGEDSSKIVAVQQGNVFGTSFHPELTGDARIHIWWLQQVREPLERKEALGKQPIFDDLASASDCINGAGIRSI